MPPTFLFLLYAVFKEPTIARPSKISPAQRLAFKLQTRQRLVSGTGLLVQAVLLVNPFLKNFTALRTVPSSIHQPE